MWQVAVLCSGCAEESEVVVEALDDVEREVCPCGYSFVTLSVASFEPVYRKTGTASLSSFRREATFRWPLSSR
jgi:hypothetical protein